MPSARIVLVVLNMTVLYAARLKKRRAEPEMAAVPGSAQARPKPVVNGSALSPQVETDDAGVQWTEFHVNQIVGWVGEGNHQVAVGEHGRITRIRESEQIAEVQFNNKYLVPLGQLYQPASTKYGFVGGGRVEFIGSVPNGGDIQARQLGIVLWFHRSEDLVAWWDLRQNKSWSIQPDWLGASTPYAPVRGNGAWVPLHTVNAGGYTLTEKIGTTKSSEETKTNTWASSVSATLSTAMKAGVGFAGFSAEVEIGASLTTELRREQSSIKSEFFAMSFEEEFQLTIAPRPLGGYLWQWQIRTELENGEVYQSKTRDFAVTAGLYQKPRCVPGYEMDGAACQVCYNEDTTIKGVGPPPTPSPTPAPTPGPTPAPTPQASSPTQRTEGFDRIWTIAGAAAWYAANTRAGIHWDAENDLQTRNAQTTLMGHDWEGSALQAIADNVTGMAQNFAYYANSHLWNNVNETFSHDYATYIQHREQVKRVLDGAGTPSDELFNQIDITVTEYAWFAAQTRRWLNLPQSNRLAEAAWAATNAQIDQLFTAGAWPLWDQ